MTTVVIAAHDEAAVLGSTLDVLMAGTRPGELEVVVAANGCSDATADVARSRAGVRVVEIDRASKTAALNAADAVVRSFPRLYLDADIAAPVETVRALVAALRGPGAPLVATPSRVLDLAGRPLPVRAYYAVQQHLPVYEDGLFGRGLIALSQEGRERFGDFPEVVADDLFLDGLFTSTERARLADVATTVATPRRTTDLVRRLVRVRRGNATLRSGPGTAVRPAHRWSWLTDVVLPRPWLAPAAAVYVAVTALAAVLARRPGPAPWGRDESTRTPGPG